MTAVKVASLRKPGYHPDGAGLYLQVSATGSKSWVFRYTRQAKSHELGLGRSPDVSLSDARDKATACRKLLIDGKDPLAEKRGLELARRMAEANIITFDLCADRYIAAHAPGWRNAKHIDQWRNTLATYASPVVGALPVDKIETAHVLRILSPIWASKTETATRLRGRIERILDWAKVQGFRTGDNPAAWRGHLKTQLPDPGKVAKVTHHPALPWANMAEFMAALREQSGLGAMAVRFIILTAARTTEALHADWAEFDLSARLWTVPAERMKAKKTHVVPLSAAAVEVLQQVQAETNNATGFVFPSRAGKPLSNMAGLAVLRRMGRADITVHGFRSTFRDWAGERTNYPKDVAEFALAHKLPDKVEAAYARSTLLDKRAAMMADWAEFCAAPYAPAAVVPIRSKMAA
jgi:integrase